VTDKPPVDYDVIVPLSAEVDGKQAVARLRPGHAQAQLLLPARLGMPIPPSGELIRYRTRDGGRAADVEVLYGATEEPTRSGPPQVVSDAYRAGWDLIFGSKVTTGSSEAN